MTLQYFQNDERPYWAATVTIDGEAEDMTSGYTFEVNVALTLDTAPELTKTSGIVGGPDGLVTVGWAVGDLDLDPGTYFAQLTATRTSDNKDWTVQDKIKIKKRLT